MESLETINVAGLEVTPLHAENRKLMRRVARREQKLEKYVKQIEEESQGHLKELEVLVNKQNYVEEKHETLMQTCKDNQMHFIYDMDARLADESQEHADQQQLEQHKNDKLPHWIGSYDAINTIIKANGHSNRLRWRSKTVAKILSCISEIMAGEPPSEEQEEDLGGSPKMQGTITEGPTNVDQEGTGGSDQNGTVAVVEDEDESVAGKTEECVTAVEYPNITESVGQIPSDSDLTAADEVCRAEVAAALESLLEAVEAAVDPGEEGDPAEFMGDDDLNACLNSCASVGNASASTGSKIDDELIGRLDGRGLQVRRILERFMLEINLTNANVMLKQFAQLRKLIRERYYNTDPVYGYTNNDEFNNITISGLLRDYEEDLEAHSVVTFAGTNDTTPSPSVAMSDAHYDDDWTVQFRERRDNRTDQKQHLGLTHAARRQERRENESSKDRRFNTSGVIKSNIRKTAAAAGGRGALNSPHKQPRHHGRSDDASESGSLSVSMGSLTASASKFVPIGAGSSGQGKGGISGKGASSQRQQQRNPQSQDVNAHESSSMELLCNPMARGDSMSMSASGVRSVTDEPSGHFGNGRMNVAADDNSCVSTVSGGSFNTMSTLNAKSRAGTLASSDVDFLNDQYRLNGVKNNTTTSADLDDKMKTFTDKVAADTKIAPDTKALIQLRNAAKNGDFRHAWSIFRKSYDPPMKPKPKREKTGPGVGHSVIGHISSDLFDDSDLDHLSVEEKEALLRKGGEWEEETEVAHTEQEKQALSRIRDAIHSNSPEPDGSLGGPPPSVNTDTSAQIRFNKPVPTADLTNFPSESTVDSKLVNGKAVGMSGMVRMSSTMSQLDNTLSKLKGEAPKPKPKKVLAELNQWSRWPHIKPKEKKLPTPGKPPISMLVFKLLMIAFKNSPGIDFRNACEVMDTLALYPDLKPDSSMFNIMMSACVRDSRWRRCMAIYTDMTTTHNILPTSQTFETIVSCCRHSLDPPAAIYECLRKEYRLPHDFCYKVASVNAGNHISNQALRQAVYESTHHAESTCEEIERKMVIEQERLDRIYGSTTQGASRGRGRGGGNMSKNSLSAGVGMDSMFTASTASFNSYTTDSTNPNPFSPDYNHSHLMTTEGDYGGTGHTYTDLSTNNSAKDIYNVGNYESNMHNNDNISVLSIVSGTDIFAQGSQTQGSLGGDDGFTGNYTRSSSPIQYDGSSVNGGRVSPSGTAGSDGGTRSISPPGSYRSRSTKTHSVMELPTLGQLLQLQERDQGHSYGSQAHSRSSAGSPSGAYSPIRSLSPLIPSAPAAGSLGGSPTGSPTGSGTKMSPANHATGAKPASFLPIVADSRGASNLPAEGKEEKKLQQKKESVVNRGVNPQKKFRKQAAKAQAKAMSLSLSAADDDDSQQDAQQNERQWRRVTASMRSLLPVVSTSTYVTPGYKGHDPQFVGGFNTSLVKRVNQAPIRKIYGDTKTRFSTATAGGKGGKAGGTARSAGSDYVAGSMNQSINDEVSVGSSHAPKSISDRFSVAPGMIDSILDYTLPRERHSPTQICSGDSVKSNDTANSINTKHTIYSSEEKRPGSFFDSIGTRNKALNVVNPYTAYTAQSRQPSQKSLP